MATSDNTQQELIIGHLGLVPPIARRVHARVRPGVELADLVSDGNLGLMRAARRFDHRRKVPFPRFAVRYVYGSIIDGLRAWSWVPRSARPGNRRDPPEPRRLLSLPHWMELPPRDDPADAMCDLLDARALLCSLPPRWRAAVELHLLGQHTLKRTGALLGVTEARACQLFHKALARLRASTGATPARRKKQPRGRRDRGVLHFSPHSDDHR